MEGSANAVSEAMVAGLPVLASDISGNRGLLGEHEGYFPVGDEVALAALLLKAEKTPGFWNISVPQQRAALTIYWINYRQWYEVLRDSRSSHSVSSAIPMDWCAINKPIMMLQQMEMFKEVESAAEAIEHFMQAARDIIL